MAEPAMIDRFTGRFLDLVGLYYGDSRRAIGLSDELAFRMIMDVMMRGMTHREATQGICPEEALVARHREYADVPILARFLFEYGALNTYFHGTDVPGPLYDNPSKDAER